jgi:stage II sporulation protein D
MNMKKWFVVTMALVLLALILVGCMQNRDPSVNWRLSDSKANLPKLPERLEIGKNGVPTLSVYDVSEKKASDMDIESYVMGVVAGEMKNDWPMEALKAQAILARTFVLKFCQDKTSKYDGADISTDVAEAQAYAPKSVNARVRQAVDETRGMALSWQGEFPNAWFHAHSGGMTELPSVALEYKGGDPEYLKPAASEESDRAPDNVKAWTATFTRAQVAKACADTGVRVGEVKTVELGEKGESGRARAILINGEAVSAPSFRLQIGANRLKSTLIDSVTLEGDAVTFSGRGFGHGVGLSQWGAYQMAEEGRTAQQILQRYFPGVGIAELW